jgi:VIT1/CCC1 family predicted Fe2+/Mn2+ transporter
VPFRVNRERLLPPVLGFVDGILTALALAAGAIVHEHRAIEAGLTLRIAIFALVTAAFVLFVARYSELRIELVREARELNLTRHGQLATTRLGRAVLAEASGDASLASAMSFVGALVPLAVASAVPSDPWLAIVVAVALLAALGVALARTIHGNPLIWASALAASGVALTLVGIELGIA